MKIQTLELKENQSLLFDDLKLTHKGGGHKITMDDKGHRSGDLSFAEVDLQTPRKELTQLRFFHPEGKRNLIVEFDDYVITTIDVGWNGEFVKMDIRKKIPS